MFESLLYHLHYIKARIVNVNDYSGQCLLSNMDLDFDESVDGESRNK